jgi:hypothetical protein
MRKYGQVTRYNAGRAHSIFLFRILDFYKIPRELLHRPEIEKDHGLHFLTDLVGLFEATLLLRLEIDRRAQGDGGHAVALAGAPRNRRPTGRRRRCRDPVVRRPLAQPVVRGGLLAQPIVRGYLEAFAPFV